MVGIGEGIRNALVALSDGFVFVSVVELRVVDDCQFGACTTNEGKLDV